MTWTASEAAEERHRAEHTYERRVRCLGCGAVADRECFEGEADPCAEMIAPHTECCSTAVEPA